MRAPDEDAREERRSHRKLPRRGGRAGRRYRALRLRGEDQSPLRRASKRRQWFVFLGKSEDAEIMPEEALYDFYVKNCRCRFELASIESDLALGAARSLARFPKRGAAEQLGAILSPGVHFRIGYEQRRRAVAHAR